jgi:hypothetical protein
MVENAEAIEYFSTRDRKTHPNREWGDFALPILSTISRLRAVSGSIIIVPSTGIKRMRSDPAANCVFSLISAYLNTAEAADRA